VSTERVIVGAGAQGRVILEVWRAQHPGDTFSFLDDDRSLHGTKVLGAEIRGPVSDLERVKGEVLLAIGNNATRRRLAERWASVSFGRAIHPRAFVSPTATIGPGSVVFAGALVNTEARIGAHVVINTGVIVEHDCVAEDFASLSPGARMGGRVSIGPGAFVSTGVTLAPRVRVGASAVVGAGAVVTRDVPDRVLAYGVPARVIAPLADDFDWKRLL
jgi:acetyltransferase EpsM